MSKTYEKKVISKCQNHFLTEVGKMYKTSKYFILDLFKFSEYLYVNQKEWQTLYMNIFYIK